MVLVCLEQHYNQIFKSANKIYLLHVLTNYRVHIHLNSDDIILATIRSSIIKILRILEAVVEAAACPQLGRGGKQCDLLPEGGGGDLRLGMRG